MNYRVAAYITSYEDPDALLRCVTAIRNQSYPVNEILVIENSASDHISHLNLDKLIVQHHPENIGISGGLRIGIPWAISQDYDFLWTFDQDSEPEKECLINLLRYYNKLTSLGCKAGILAPKVIDIQTGQILNGMVFNEYRYIELKEIDSRHDFYECDAVITSGSLVSVSAARSTALPHPDLFIDAVDWEYCSNLKKNSFMVAVIRDAVLMHRYGKSIIIKSKWISKSITVNNYSALRYFYIFRNHTFIETRLCSTKGQLLRSVLYRFRCLAVISAKIIIYEREKVFGKVWACFSGVFYGLTGKLGNKS